MATRTIGVGAGIGTPDFSSIAAWWASLPATLTENETAQIRWASSANELVTTDTSVYGGKNFNGFRVTIEPYPGEGFRDNPGRLTNALRYNASNGACIRANASAAKCLSFNMPGGSFGSFTIRGLQLRAHNVGSYQSTCITLSSVFDNIIENNILEGSITNSALLYVDSNHSGAANANDTIVRNNVFVVKGSGATAALLRRNGTATFYKLYDNTAVNVSGSAGTSLGLIVFNSYHNFHFFNNVSIGFNEDFRMPAGSAVKLDGFNATDKTSGASGIRTSATSQYEAVGATEFENFTSGSEDLRLRNAAVKCFNTGTDTYGLFNDIYNQLPAGPRDIGAHENQTGGPPPGWPWLVRRDMNGGLYAPRVSGNM